MSLLILIAKLASYSLLALIADDAGYHAAHMEGAGATGEDTVRKRTGICHGEVGYLLSRGGTHNINKS